MFLWTDKKNVFLFPTFIWSYEGYVFLNSGSVPPPQGAPPTGYGYARNPDPKPDNFTANIQDPEETSVRDSFGDYGSFSDKAIRRGFIRKVGLCAK